LADTDQKLRDIFIPKDDGTDLACLVTDTGYRVPLTNLKVTDKESLCKAVREFHTIIIILPECEGKKFHCNTQIIFSMSDREVVTPNGTVVLPEHILIFFTGTDCVPPLRFQSLATLMFIPGVLAKASTCNFILYLPHCLESYNTFKDFMIESFISHGGFGFG